MKRAVVLAKLAVVFVGSSLPAVAAPAFKHVVIIVQENRTPDNIFGSNPNFEPGVDIATSVLNSKKKPITLTSLPLDDCYDISHSHGSFEDAFTMGFDKSPAGSKNKSCQVPSNPQFKFADNSSGVVQPYFDIATQYGFANRMFQTNQGPSYPAHQFIFGGTSAPAPNTPLFVAENPKSDGRILAGCAVENPLPVSVIDEFGNEKSHPPVDPCFERPTLTDRLEAAGLSWKYYATTQDGIWLAPNSIAHICNARKQGGTLACSGPEWTTHVNDTMPAQVLTDIANCQLANVVWVTPTSKASDHPGSNNGTGPSWVASIINAVGKQTCGNESYWDDTAIFVTWDDWGGFADHVQPFATPAPGKWGAGYTYGFRVPLLVASAYTAPGTVSNATLDFGSLLYFTEQNFGLSFIGPATKIHTQYADYQAQSRGALEDFFTLGSPQPFTQIAAPKGGAYFLSLPPSSEPPDSE